MVDLVLFLLQIALVFGIAQEIGRLTDTFVHEAWGEALIAAISTSAEIFALYAILLRGQI